MLHNLHQNVPNDVIIVGYDSASCGCGGAVKHAVWVYVTCLVCLLGQEQWWLVCTECSSVFVVMVLGVAGYSLVTVVDMACDITLPATLCWMRFLPTSPESSATSQSPVERSSCRPHLRAMLIAARLLSKVLVDLTCKLQTTSHSVVLAALLLKTEWIRLGWDLEELPSFVKLVSPFSKSINGHFGCVCCFFNLILPNWLL